MPVVPELRPRVDLHFDGALDVRVTLRPALRTFPPNPADVAVIVPPGPTRGTAFPSVAARPGVAVLADDGSVLTDLLGRTSDETPGDPDVPRALCAALTLLEAAPDRGRRRVLLVTPEAPRNRLLLEALVRRLVARRVALDVLAAAPHLAAWSRVTALARGLAGELGPSVEDGVDAHLTRLGEMVFDGASLTLEGGLVGVGDVWYGPHTTCPPLRAGESWECRARLSAPAGARAGLPAGPPRLVVDFPGVGYELTVPVVRRKRASVA